MITKKNDWKKGEWAFTVKAITADGTIVEYDCPHVKTGGKETWEHIGIAVGIKLRPPETIPHEKVYSDPSAAHEWASRMHSMGRNTMISHDHRGFVVRWEEKRKNDDG